MTHYTRMPEHELEAKLAMSFAELGLDVRTCNMLEGVGCDTVEDVLVMTREELFAIPNFGEKTYQQIMRSLADLGFIAEDAA